MPKIPKIIHQIWINDTKEIPVKYIPYVSSVISKHPGWEYILWDVEKAKNLGMRTLDRFNELDHWAYRADILRYEIMHRFGGVYLDCDFQLLRPLDSILEIPEVVEKGAFLCNEDENVDDYMSIGVFGAVPGHEIFGAATSRALTINFDYTKSAYLLPTGPMFFRRSILHIDTAHILPTRTFYPVSYRESGANENGEAFGIHHWAKNWGEDPK
jgi:mannosyltransferase OCH1-like enzyme